MSEGPDDTGRSTPGALGPAPVQAAGATGANARDGVTAEDKTLAQRTLDLLVFAPTGLVVTAIEDLPGFAARGRATIEVQIRNARLVGEFALRKGRRDLTARVARVSGSRAGRPSRAPVSSPRAPGPTTGHASTVATNGIGEGQRGDPGPLAPSIPSGGGSDAPAADLAIFDYETLSASQVVRRLDGLGPRELEAVYRHEAASRRRRTILHRAQQLLGAEEQPGTPGVTA